MPCGEGHPRVILIQVRCDNAAVVAILRSGTSKDKLAMHLVRCLAFFKAEFGFTIVAEHLPGRLNIAADALSRDKLSHFFQICPKAPQTPVVIPQELFQALIATQLDWTSVSWKRMFHSILGKGLAKSTQNTYKAGQARYIKFCAMFSWSPFPISESCASSFVAFLAGEGLKHGTIKVYLSGVRYSQIAAGYKDPFATPWHRLEYVLKGIKRDQAEKGIKSKPRLPMTPTILRKLKQVWNVSSEDHDTKMIWAACCLGFFGFLRCGEMTVPSYDPSCHLSYRDLAVDHQDKPNTIKIRIKASKTDPFRKGVDIFLGRTGTDLCPVTALLNYLCARGSSQGPLFVFADGKLLSRSQFVDRLRKGLREAGIDPTTYCSHSRSSNDGS